MLVPLSSGLRPPEGSATPCVSSSSRSRDSLTAAAYGLPLAALLFYAWSFWGSPAFGELADQGYHLELARAFADAWMAGEFPPAWSATANGGRGSPAFQLYPPLFPWWSACWIRLVDSDTEAIRFSSLTTVLFNLFAIYWAARGWLSSARAWTASGVALLLPGPVFVALGRGMFPNFLALGWAALALGAGLRSLTRPRYTALLALAGAGLILSHTPTALLAVLLGATLALVCGRRAVLHGIVAGVIALGVTAWFWAPMLRTARDAQTSYLTEAHPYVASLWLSEPAISSAFDRDWAFLNGTAALFGAAQVLLAAGLLAALRPGPLRRCVTLLLAWTVFASIPPTGEWLAALPGYANVQFCWRWQPLLSVGCAFAFASLPVRSPLRLTPAAAVVILVFLPLGAPSSRPPGQAPNLASNLIEMRPLGASRERFPPGPPGLVETVSGDCGVAPVDLRPSRRIYRISAETPCRIRVLTYHFPGWTALLDGEPAAIRPEHGTALQLLDIPAGAHTLVLRYGDNT